MSDGMIGIIILIPGMFAVLYGYEIIPIKKRIRN
jgi:hypothetical protein